MAFDTSEILICVTTLFIAIYFYSTSTFNFWKSRNITGPKPIPIFGTIKDIMLGKHSIGTYLRKVYKEYPNEPMIGIYTRSVPVLLLNDMDIIKTILIKDFKSFIDRGMGMNEKHEPLTAHLFNLEAKRWRPLRTKLTPAFTSGKLREMFYLLIECADQLHNHLEQMKGQSVNIREIAAKFMTDTIGVCAFGLQANSLTDDDSTFRQMGRRIFESNWKNIVKFRMRNFSPLLYDYIGGFLADNVVTNFFLNITRDTILYRKKNNINRHDFIDIMMELQNEPSKIDDIELTNALTAAQLFVFFIAGFETSSSTVSNCLFELALNHNVRDKVRDEIKKELSKSNGIITYEGIKNMHYLDKVSYETLRKYPPVPAIMRKSTSPYTFPGTKVSIPVGTHVWIPILGIQHDEKYFPNPETFDPERFSEDAKKNRPTMAFLSFGEGPRNCIGARFGKMQTKVALVKILQNYTVDVCEKTEKNYVINPYSFLLAPKNGIHIKITKDKI